MIENRNNASADNHDVLPNTEPLLKISNLSNIRKAGLYLLLVFTFYIWYQAIINVIYTGTLFAYRDMRDFCLGVAVNFTSILILFVIDTLIVFKIKWKRDKLYRVFIDFILSLFSPVVVNAIFFTVCLILGQNGSVRWLMAFVLNFMILILNEVVWFMANYQHTQRLYEQSLRLASQMEYKVLRAQVNPHFLFNSLNILYSLSHLDIKKSQEFILSLSRMYRYIMARRGSITVSLKDELSFLKAYVEVLEILYYDSFEIQITGLEHVHDQHILPYSLQLLVENVTKHNVIHKTAPMTVYLNIEPHSLSVSNNINLKSDSTLGRSSNGVGLEYMTKLYNLYDKTVSFTNDNGVFKVTVPYINPEIIKE